MSPILIRPILGVFVKTLTANVKYPIQDCGNLSLRIQMHLASKGKTFSEFLFNLWNLHQILTISGKCDRHS